MVKKIKTAQIVTYLPLLFLICIKLLLHLYAISNYGYYPDELLYLDYTQHPSFGYVTTPALIGLIAKIQVSIFGNSLTSIRIIPILTGIALIFITYQMTKTLKGGPFARFIAAFSILVAPGYLTINFALTPYTFELLLWTLVVYVCIYIFVTGKNNFWLLFGLLLGLALENFYLTGLYAFILIFSIGMIYGKKVLLKWQFIAGCFIAFILFLPNIAWQINGNFQTFEYLINKYNSHNGVSMNLYQLTVNEITMMNPITFPIWIAGFFSYFLDKQNKKFMFVGISFLLVYLVVYLFLGRIFYLAPLFPPLIAAGAVQIEKSKTFKPPFTKTLLVLAFIFALILYAPAGLPILSPNSYKTYAKITHIKEIKIWKDPEGFMPQIFANMFEWKELTNNVSHAYNKLTNEEKSQTAIIAGNYAEAGAINIYGPQYNLPKAISTHLDYYNWKPKNLDPKNLIIVGGINAQRNLYVFCSSLTLVGNVYSPYGLPFENQPILLCRDLKKPLNDIWPSIKNWKYFLG